MCTVSRVTLWCDGDLFVNVPAVWFLNQEQSEICQVFVIQQAQLSFEHLVEAGMEDAKGVRGREGEYSPFTCCFVQPTTWFEGCVRPATYGTFNYTIGINTIAEEAICWWN